MELTSDEFFERLLLSYSDYFDIIRDTSYKDLSVAAEAAFSPFSEKYVLVKKAQLWAAEAHEYVFFIRTGHLERRLFALTTMHCLRKACHVWNRKRTTCTPMCLSFFWQSLQPLKCLSLLKRHAVTETIACRFMVGWITVSQHMTVLRKGLHKLGRDDR